MEALQADKRTGLNSLNAPTDGAPKNALHESVRRFLLIYILKAEIVNDGRKGAERTNSKVQEAFPAEQWFQDAHRFP